MWNVIPFSARAVQSWFCLLCCVCRAAVLWRLVGQLWVWFARWCYKHNDGWYNCYAVAAGIAAYLLAGFLTGWLVNIRTARYFPSRKSIGKENLSRLLTNVNQIHRQYSFSVWPNKQTVSANNNFSFKRNFQLIQNSTYISGKRATGTKLFGKVSEHLLKLNFHLLSLTCG